jgi:hypothetical protein
VRSKEGNRATVGTELGHIPSYMDIPTGVFKDINHYRKVVSGVTKALARGRARTKSSSGSYLFDGLEIEFKKGLKHEAIFLDHVNSKIILRAPIKARETEENKRKRIMFYHAELLKSVEQMKVHGISSIYLAISENGRKKLSQ